MLGRIVDHVASLAKGREIAQSRSAEGGIVIKVGGRKIYRLAGHAYGVERNENWRTADQPPATIAPRPYVGVKPDTVRADKLRDVTSVRTMTMLTAATGTLEPNDPADLRPVDRIEPAMFRTDRHERILNHCGAERKEKMAAERPFLIAGSRVGADQLERLKAGGDVGLGKPPSGDADG